MSSGVVTLAKLVEALRVMREWSTAVYALLRDHPETVIKEDETGTRITYGHVLATLNVTGEWTDAVRIALEALAETLPEGQATEIPLEDLALSVGATPLGKKTSCGIGPLVGDQCASDLVALADDLHRS